MFFEIPDQVARAISLDACARYRGAPPDDARPLYGLEGHARRGVYAFHCQPVLIPLLIRDIKVTAARSQLSKFRELCAQSIASLGAEIARPDTRGTAVCSLA